MTQWSTSIFMYLWIISRLPPPKPASPLHRTHTRNIAEMSSHMEFTSREEIAFSHQLPSWTGVKTYRDTKEITFGQVLQCFPLKAVLDWGTKLQVLPEDFASDIVLCQMFKLLVHNSPVPSNVQAPGPQLPSTVQCYQLQWTRVAVLPHYSHSIGCKWRNESKSQLLETDCRLPPAQSAPKWPLPSLKLIIFGSLSQFPGLNEWLKNVSAAATTQFLANIQCKTAYSSISLNRHKSQFQCQKFPSNIIMFIVMQPLDEICKKRIYELGETTLTSLTAAAKKRGENSIEQVPVQLSSIQQHPVEEYHTELLAQIRFSCLCGLCLACLCTCATQCSSTGLLTVWSSFLGVRSFTPSPQKVLTYRKMDLTGDVRGLRWCHPKIQGGQRRQNLPTKLRKYKKATKNSQCCRCGVICESPQFECSSVTVGTQNCEPMYSKLCVTVWRTHSMQKLHSKTTPHSLCTKCLLTENNLRQGLYHHPAHVILNRFHWNLVSGRYWVIISNHWWLRRQKHNPKRVVGLGGGQRLKV